MDSDPKLNARTTTRYDLEERLLDLAVLLCRVAESLPSTKVGNHVAGQLIRCCTSPAPNYGEAQGAESRKDFVHKMRVCLKELRECGIWLKFILKMELVAPDLLIEALRECKELTAIFTKSVETARRRLEKS